jgi:hypothetical protein
VRHARYSAKQHANTSTSRLRYFWWAEFQKRGALHYHAILVDPPFARERDARHWFDKHWAAALPPREHRTQCDVQFRGADWFRKKGGDYVLKDLRKLGGKTYEQDYSRMPRGWRTFRSHQLAFTAAEHQEHESKAWTVCTAAPDRPWHERQHDIWIYRIDVHVPASCGCRLYRRKVRGRAKHGVCSGVGVASPIPSCGDQHPGISLRENSEALGARPIVALPLQAADRLPLSCPQVSATLPALSTNPLVPAGGVPQQEDVTLTAPLWSCHSRTGPLHERREL